LIPKINSDTNFKVQHLNVTRFENICLTPLVQKLKSMQLESYSCNTSCLHRSIYVFYVSLVEELHDLWLASRIIGSERKNCSWSISLLKYSEIVKCKISFFKHISVNLLQNITRLVVMTPKLIKILYLLSLCCSCLTAASGLRFADKVGLVECDVSITKTAPAQVAEADGSLISSSKVIRLSVLPVPQPSVHIASVRPVKFTWLVADVSGVQPKCV
jgi:hypothetical protein